VDEPPDFGPEISCGATWRFMCCINMPPSTGALPAHFRAGRSGWPKTQFWSTRETQFWSTMGLFSSNGLQLQPDHTTTLPSPRQADSFSVFLLRTQRPIFFLLPRGCCYAQLSEGSKVWSTTLPSPRQAAALWTLQGFNRPAGIDNQVGGAGAGGPPAARPPWLHPRPGSIQDKMLIMRVPALESQQLSP
jgi:hypothetical protein